MTKSSKRQNQPPAISQPMHPFSPTSSRMDRLTRQVTDGRSDAIDNLKRTQIVRFHRRLTVRHHPFEAVCDGRWRLSGDPSLCRNATCRGNPSLSHVSCTLQDRLSCFQGPPCPLGNRHNRRAHNQLRFSFSQGTDFLVGHGERRGAA